MFKLYEELMGFGLVPIKFLGSIPFSLTYLLSLGFSSSLSDALKNPFLGNQGLLPPCPHSVFEEN